MKKVFETYSTKALRLIASNPLIRPKHRKAAKEILKRRLGKKRLRL